MDKKLFIKKLVGALAFYVGLWSGVAEAKPAQAQKIMVSGPSSHLVKTVQDITRKGGNIFDAAIAGAFTLSVTHPYFVSLGCGGFALLKDQSKVRALDFREIAPAKVTSDFYLKSGLSSVRLGSAVGVPGFVAGQWAIHQKYGSLPWSDLIKPAIKLASRGFMVSGEWLSKTKGKAKDFNLSGKRTFFHSDGTPYWPGEFLRQKQLAGALMLIKRKNKTLFYNGMISKDIVDTVQKNKGVMDLKDLKQYKPRWLKPVSFPLGRYQVYSMPLPSSGGIIMARASHLMNQKQIHKLSLYSISEWHFLSEILALAFRPRNQMGDLTTPAPYLKNWLSDRKLRELGNQIALKKAQKLPPVRDTLHTKKRRFKESRETTHFSIMNDKGQAVSMTLTLNGNFGSFLVTDKYGIVLNNQMDDFNTRPGKPNQFGLIQGKNNRSLGGKRPLSSMSPTIVERRGRAVMALGAAGGPMIISAVWQTMYRHLMRKMDLDLSLQSPRLHHQFLPRALFVEKQRFSPVVVNLLRNRGHYVLTRDSIAKVYAVSKNRDGLLEGAFDARGEGAVGGL